MIVGGIVEGADPNAQGGFYGNELQAASFTGNTEAMRLLLEGEQIVMRRVDPMVMPCKQQHIVAISKP